MSGFLEVRMRLFFLRGNALNEMTKHFACQKGFISRQSLISNRVGGSRRMLPRDVLEFRSEIAGNMYFSIHFCTFKAFKEENQVT